MKKIAQAAGVTLPKSSAVSFASRMVKRSKASTMQICMVHVRRVDADYGESVLRTGVPLAFVKSGYLTKICILGMRYVDLENGFIGEPFVYERRLQRIFAMGLFGSSSKKRNSFALVPNCRKMGEVL